MIQAAAYILAGGRSSRFGSDKARAELRGKPLIVHVAEAMGAVAAGVTVIADDEGKYADLGLRTIVDMEPGLGPIGGLVTACVDSAGPWIWVAACDLAVIKRAWLEQLAANLDESAQAVAFKSDRWEGVLGLYRVDLRGTLLRQIHQGERSLQMMLNRIDAVAVNPPSDWPGEPSVNTPEDLKRYEDGV